MLFAILNVKQIQQIMLNLLTKRFYDRHEKPIPPHNPTIATAAAPAVIVVANAAPATKRPTVKAEPPMHPQKLAPPLIFSICSKFIVFIISKFLVIQ